MVVLTADTGFKVVFGSSRAELSAPDGATGNLKLPLPLLGGRGEEFWPVSGATSRWEGPFLLTESAETLMGAAIIDGSGRLEEPVEETYRKMIDLCSGWNLHRIWNYIPEINRDQGGLERYRQFNIGRWAAFESKYGRDLRSFLPAASGVGVQGSDYIIVFKAGRVRPVFDENPSQVPAYHYPADYGPKPPGFARGVVVDRGGIRTAFLSGTASIEGHSSVGVGDIATQFRTTLHNIDIMFSRLGVSEGLDPEAWASGQVLDGYFRCYLRHPSLLPKVRSLVQEHIGIDEKRVTYVQAEICRRELDLEIEALVRCKRPVDCGSKDET